MSTVNIPGWDANPDRAPAVPNAYDEEFDSALSGWTAINGGFLTYDADATRPSYLTMTVTPTTGEHAYGIYKPAPPTPFVMTAKVSGWVDFSDGAYCYQAWGIGVGEATPGRFLGLWAPNNEYTDTTLTIEFNEWVNPNLFAHSLTFAPTAESYGMLGEWYLRLVVDSPSQIRPYYSPNGLLWLPRYGNYAPAPVFSGGGLSVILAEIQNPGSAKGCSGAFDWVRFTT